MIDLLVLGTVELLLDGRPVEVSGAKERTLLALLLTAPGRVIGVDTLIGELWRKDPPSSATSSLHVFVSRLRSQLRSSSSRLATHATGYALAAEPSEFDAGRFGLTISEARLLQDEGDLTAAAAQFRTGLALWRGSAFAGVDSLLVSTEATRLEESRTSAREALLETELSLGHHTAVIPELDEMIAEHPFHERFWALRMLALYRSGRQADTLRTYQSLRALTRDQLGFEPTPELQRLELAVLEHDPSLDWVDVRTKIGSSSAAVPTQRTAPHDARKRQFPTPPGLQPPTGTPLVGRDHLLSRIDATRHQNDPGRCKVVLISGEPGVGKSRLASAAALRASNEGANVLLGRCDEESLGPYQPFAEAIRWVLDQISPDELAARCGARAAEHLAVLAGQAGPDSRSARTPTDADRVEMFEAVSAVLKMLATSSPLVLVLEDLHWADPPTVALLRYVVRRLEGEPASLLITCRADEVGREHPLHGIVASLQRNSTVVEVPIGGLDPVDVRDLAAALLGRSIAPDLSQSLHEGTAGNPLFVVELMRHLVDAGVLGAEPEPGEAAAVRRAVLPAGIREIVTRRAAGLPTGADRALSVGAGLGREFDTAVLAAVLGEAPTVVGEHLDQATGAGLVAPVEELRGRYTFTHAVVRDAFYLRLSGSERSALHGQIAAVLEENGWGTAAELALHYFESAATGSVDKALEFGRRAAVESRHSLAFEDGVEILERTLTLARARGTTRVRLEILIELGEARWWAGDADGSNLACTEALEAARRDADGELFARAVLGRWRSNGAATQGFSASAPDNDLVDMLEEALVDLTEHPALRAALLGRLGIASYWTAPLDRRRELCESAVALARAAGDELVLLDALVDRQLALWTPGAEEDRLSRAPEILALARKLGQPAREADARIFQALDQLCLGDAKAADTSIQRYLRASALLRQPYYRWHAHFLPALRSMMNGDFAEAESLSAAGIAEGEGSGGEGAMSLGGLQMLWLLYERGRLHEIAPVLDEVGTSFGEIPALNAARTWVAAESGDFDKARALLADLASNDFNDVKQDIAWLSAMCLLGSAAATVGDLVAGAQLYAALAPHAGRNAVVWVGFCSGPVDHYLGLLAHSFGDPDKAVEHWDQAERHCRQMGAVPLELRVRFDRCRLQLTQENSDRVAISAELTRIARSAEDLGMSGVAERAVALLGD